MRIENSPVYEAEAAVIREKWTKERRHSDRKTNQARHDCWPFSPPWQPMKTCPFAALAGQCGYNGLALVADDKSIALISVRKRFGRPLVWVGDGDLEYVFRDGTICLEGDGKLEEPDAPAWWFKWELLDANGTMTYAGGEETGMGEIGFIPTRWFILPSV